MQIYQLLGLFYGEKERFNTNIQQYNLVKNTLLSHNALP